MALRLSIEENRVIELDPQAGAASRSDVMRAIRNAASATGADFDYLVKTARRESNFDADARARTSTATGLFQFTENTWLRMVDRYGAQHGLKVEADAISVSGRKVQLNGEVSRADILALRNDPDLSARMAGELARENAGILEKKIGRAPTSAELSTAHFMGPRDAGRLINAARANTPGSAAEMFPSAAAANANIFRSADGARLSVAQLYGRLTGAELSDADAGRIPAASLSSPVSPFGARGAFAISAGAAQMASSLLTALFEIQTESAEKRAETES